MFGDVFLSDQLDSLPQAVVSLSHTGRLQSANQVWFDMYGFEPGSSKLPDFHNYLHPKDVLRFDEAFEQVVVEPLAINLILRVIDGSGQDRWSDVYLRSSYLGESLKVVASIMDIGERVGRERLLLAEQRSTNSILDDLPGMVYRCPNSPDWPMEYVSAGCRDLTGYESVDIIQNRKVAYGSLIVREDRERVWEEVQNGLRERRRFELVYRLRTADGSLKWVWEKGRGIYSADGEWSGIEGIIMDFNRQVMYRTTGQHKGLQCGEMVDDALFYERLSEVVRRHCEPSNMTPRLYCINLDRYEHFMAAAGFHQLFRGHRYVADLLQRIAGSDGFVHSPQPDRWYLYSENPKSPEQEINELEAAFFDPIQLNGRQLYVSVSVGCANITPVPAGVEQVIRVSEQALNYCMQTGGGTRHIRDLDYML